MKRKLVFFLVGMALFILALVLKAEGILTTGQSEAMMGEGLLLVIIPLVQLVFTTLKK